MLAILLLLNIGAAITFRGEPFTSIKASQGLENSNVYRIQI